MTYPRAAVAVLAAGLALVGCSTGAPQGAGPGGQSSVAPSRPPLTGPTAARTAMSHTATPAAATGESFSAPPSDAAEPQPRYTLADYLRERGIAETVVEAGMPTDVEAEFALPADWQIGAPATMPDAYLVAYQSAEDDEGSADLAPNALVFVSRLEGPVDTAGLLAQSADDLRAAPEFAAAAEGPTQVNGYPAYQLHGTYRDPDLGAIDSWHEVVLVPISADLHYLVQLTITVREAHREQAQAAVSEIAGSFTVWQG
jgi:hypothetical protein